MHKQAVLFDLDGTLADTAVDLAYALNQTLLHYGHQALPLEQIRPVVSFGGIALIKLGFGIVPEHPDFENRRQFLLKVYQDNICRQTRLFDGMEEVLKTLESQQIVWGVVTNKPSWLTDPLMQALQLDSRAACIVSGDTCANNKPHPEPLLHACKIAGVDPQNTLYVGDAERDIQAGKAAGCKTVTALFGYLTEDDQPENWQADFSIETPLEILDLLPEPVS